VEPSFIKPGVADITLPVALKNFTNYQLAADSPLRTAGLDLPGVFGINNGGRTFNQQTVPVKGIGACV
jgi:hypothetical protein